MQAKASKPEFFVDALQLQRRPRFINGSRKRALHLLDRSMQIAGLTGVKHWGIACVTTGCDPGSVLMENVWLNNP